MNPETKSASDLNDDDIRALAARYGLLLQGPLDINELGLDYRVVIASAADGTPWVLRIPRRADVSAKVAAEARALAMLRAHLPFAVPDWRVAAADLVAYPLLDDRTAIILEPGSTTPEWVIQQDSEAFLTSLAAAMAALHAIPVAAAQAGGMLVRSPSEARQQVADDIERVCREIAVHAQRRERWQRWLADDASWPDFCVPVHGDLYVGHVLVDATERVSAMIDWSECRVDDPAIDMVAHLMVFGPASLARLIEAYQACGGRTWSRMAHHIEERLAVWPVSYALFGLESGDPHHLAAAQAQLADAE